MTLFSNTPNVSVAVIKLLKSLAVDVQLQAVTDELEKHPDYPSLLSVSDVLTAFKVENSAIRLDFDELANLPCPFLALFNDNNGELVMVKKVKNNFFYLESDNWINEKFSTDEFKKKYAGVVLVAETPEEQQSLPKLKSLLSAFKAPLIIAGFIFILVSLLSYHSVIFSNYGWQAPLLALIKTAGLITSVLLLMQSVDSNNPLIQKLCGSNGGKTDCNAILSSKAAKVPIAIISLTWSEVGFFYFAGTWLLLLFGGNSALTWTVLALMNLLSLPYTFYSVYYQALVAKKWCLLCCTVQGLLWLEFTLLLLIYSKLFQLSFLSFGEGFGEAFSTLFICLFTPVILWVVLKPLFLKLQQVQPLKEQLRKFKYNAELFDKMLAGQPKYPLPGEDWSIVIGNTEAGNIITMVTNPYCPPCAKMHQSLDELLSLNADVQARIVFTADNSDKDIKTPVTRHLMALNELADKAIIRKALHDWYEQKQKNYEAWAKVYPVELDTANFHKLDRQKSWCEMAEVTATPTMLLNGYRLPEIYHLPDLKYMLQ